LIVLQVLPDFDSAIRRFDPSRRSQLILLVKSPSPLPYLEMAQSAVRRREIGRHGEAVGD
jgi:hypothetical protein